MQMSGVFPTLGQEAEYRALGKVWKAGRLTVKVQQRLWEWVQPQLPNYYEPLEKIIDKLDPQKAMMMTSHAAEQMAAQNSITCEQAQTILRRPDGIIREFMELLRDNHPDVTFDQAYEILRDLGRQKLQVETDKHNAANPDVSPISVEQYTALAGLTEEQILAWQQAIIRRKAEGEYPPAPKDTAPAA